MAQCWMHKLKGHYGKKCNGMYIDSHMWEDVVRYQEEFIKWWEGDEKCMVTYNNDGNVLETTS